MPSISTATGGAISCGARPIRSPRLPTTCNRSAGRPGSLGFQKPRSFWAQYGVTYRNGNPIPADNMPVSLHLPMGRNGPAFLAYPNFTTVYLDWNNSLVYSTTAAYYATRLAGAPPLAKGNPEAFTAAQTKELQQLLARQGFDVGKIDGVLGAGTREAIRTMQIKYGLPADSYPSAELLSALRAGR
jgi:hypothetical protein